MRRLVMTAALLFGPAQVGGAQAQTVPGQTPGQGAATSLLLSAPVGASAEFTMTTTSSSRIADVQVSAAPGSGITAAQLDRLRQEMTRGTAPTPPVTISGKAFFRVAARTPGGQTSLLTTVIQNLPGQAPLTMRITQTIGPDGQVTAWSLDSDNPVVKRAFASLTPAKMQEVARQNGSNVAGLYGVPWRVGEAHTVTARMDTLDLLRGVLGAVTGPAGAGLIAGLKAEPLSVTTTTTYRGLNAQGLHEFAQRTSADPWKVSLPPGDDLPMAVELLSMEGRSTQTFRRDGLPGASTDGQSQRLRLTMLVDGAQIAMTILQDQTVTITPR